MRQKYSVQYFNLVAFTPSHHCGNEIARSVIAETGRLIPRRAIVRTGDVRDVMFEVVLLKSQLRNIRIEGLRQQRPYVAHSLFPLTKADEIQNLGRVRKRILNFLREIRIAILTNGHVLDIRDLCAHRIQAGFDCQSRESAEMLMTVEPLLS